MKVILTMIMKDEEKNLPRSIGSALPFIDYYVICDTGSSDKSIDVALELLKGKEGKIFSEKWTGNYGYHRNTVLNRARYHTKRWELEDRYGMILDCDEEVKKLIIPEDSFGLGNCIMEEDGKLKHRNFLVNLNTDLKFSYAIHECIQSYNHKWVVLDSMVIAHNAGCHNRMEKKAKLLHDLNILTNDEESKERYNFFYSYYYNLAQIEDDKTKKDEYISQTIYYCNKVINDKVNFTPANRVCACLFIANFEPDPLNVLLKASDIMPESIQASYSLMKYFYDKGQFNLLKLFYALAVNSKQDFPLIGEETIEEQKKKVKRLYFKVKNLF